MKKNVKILFSLIIGIIACSCTGVLAYSSKNLTTKYDGRYCYYQGQADQKINDQIMNQILKETKNTGDGITLKLPTYNGITSYSIVINGQLYRTAKPGTNVKISADKANKNQIQIYRNASSTVCTFDESNTKSNKATSCVSHNNACAIGYLNTFSNSYLLKSEVSSLATIAEKRNYTNGRSTITITRKQKQAVLANGDKVNYKIDVYEDVTAGLRKLASLEENATNASFTISPRGSLNTVYIQYVATSGNAKGAILASGDESYLGYEKNKTKDNAYCKKIIESSKNFGNFIDICKPSNIWIDYGANLTEEELKSSYEVYEKFYSQIGERTVGKNASLLTSVKKTSNPREKQTLFCKFNQAKNQTQTYTYDTREESKYFIKVCRETVKIEYDSPKLVSNNGGGFTYDVTITPTVECYAKIKEDAFEKLINATEGAQCTVRNGCWGTDKNFPGYLDKGNWDGGPSEDFDACINTCDGGNYTQACINSCYTKVYGNNKTTNTNRTYASQNSGLLRINYTGKYSDGADKYSDAWCSLPSKADNPQGSADSYTIRHHDSNGNAIMNRPNTAGKGKYYCVKAKVGNNNINIQKYWKSTGCQSTCYTMVTNPKNGKTIKKVQTYNNKGYYDSNIVADEDNYIKELGCFLNTRGELISLNESEIKKFVNEWSKIKQEVEDMNKKSTEYPKAKYTYQIHDSSERFCNNKEYITYEESSNKNPLSVTKGSQDIQLGFPNTCLKNGNVKNKNGCCTKEEGLSGGNKFYMAVTTENNINNVFSWPTDNKANFTTEEKETIKEIKQDAESKLGGLKVRVYDTDTYANDKTKEYCDETSGFNYNIKAKLEKLGFLGDDNNKWNFDINCFYGYYNTRFATCGAEWKDIDTDGDGQNDTTVIKETVCQDDKENGNKQTTTLVNDYLFRTVDVTNLFNSAKDKTKLPWNWQKSKTTDAVTESFESRKINYNVNPEQTIKNIEDTGYAYTDLRNFQFVMNSTNMRNIRKYNDTEKTITTTHCNQKDLGCSNTFIRNASYFEKTNISDGTGVFNNIRDIK